MVKKKVHPQRNPGYAYDLFVGLSVSRITQELMDAFLVIILENGIGFEAGNNRLFSIFVIDINVFCSSGNDESLVSGMREDQTTPCDIPASYPWSRSIKYRLMPGYRLKIVSSMRPVALEGLDLLLSLVPNQV